jgi:hypothetical protein
MHARIGVLRALNRNVERTFNPFSQRYTLVPAQAKEGPITNPAGTIPAARD